MEFEEIMLYLEEHGSEQNRRIYGNHGIPDPKYGVKVSDLKKLQKIIKKDYNLSLRLFDTVIYMQIFSIKKKKMACQVVRNNCIRL